MAVEEEIVPGRCFNKCGGMPSITLTMFFFFLFCGTRSVNPWRVICICSEGRKERKRNEEEGTLSGIAGGRMLKREKANRVFKAPKKRKAKKSKKEKRKGGGTDFDFW